MFEAIVTGGYNGLLGPVWVQALKSRGYEVDILDRPDFNMGFDSDIEGFCEGVRTPSVVVHNAAVDPKPGADEGKDPFRRHEEIMMINHIGVAHMNSILIPRMIANGGGVIVIIGSIMGYIAANQENYSDGWTKAFAYNESKAALISHCHNINSTFGKYNIRAVMPSFGPYAEGLSEDFMAGFGQKIPVRHPVWMDDLFKTLYYCLDCESLAGELRVDGGYTRVGR